MIWLKVYNDWQLISLCDRTRVRSGTELRRRIHTYVVVSSAIKLRTRNQFLTRTAVLNHTYMPIMVNSK